MAIPAHASFPAGGTWFDTLNKSFVDVKVESSPPQNIATTDFLEAAESLCTLFGVYEVLSCKDRDEMNDRSGTWHTNLG